MTKAMWTVLAALMVSACWASCPVNAQDVGDQKIAAIFECPAPSAKAVYLVGDFNGWLSNDNGKIKEKPEWLMKKDDYGNWKLTVKLVPGNYSYMYVVDGKWKVDVSNLNTIDDGNGGKYSVKIVTK